MAPESSVMDIGFDLNTEKEVLTENDVTKSLKEKSYRIVVIEINPYGKMSGGALFSWQEKVLAAGPLEFRLSH